MNGTLCAAVDIRQPQAPSQTYFNKIILLALSHQHQAWNYLEAPQLSKMTYSCQFILSNCRSSPVLSDNSALPGQTWHQAITTLKPRRISLPFKCWSVFDPKTGSTTIKMRSVVSETDATLELSGSLLLSGPRIATKTMKQLVLQ